VGNGRVKFFYCWAVVGLGRAEVWRTPYLATLGPPPLAIINKSGATGNASSVWKIKISLFPCDGHQWTVADLEKLKYDLGLN
jgi:hypothetical protein